jgi:hypothetical protein
VLIGLFHLGYDPPRAPHEPRVPYVHLNNDPPSDPRYDELWSIVRLTQAAGVEVMASLGGGSVGDYGNLFDAYDTFYPLLRDTLREYAFDGIDLDIEEPSVTTTQVQRLLRDLRADFAEREGFAITSAPVGSALVGDPPDWSKVDYRSLLPLFDWYNVQFYNGEGDIVHGGNEPWNPTYEQVVAAVGVENAHKLVAGVLTNKDDGGSGYSNVRQVAAKATLLASRYWDMGGIDGWTYQNAVGPSGVQDPVGWAQTLTEAFAMAEPFYYYLQPKAGAAASLVLSNEPGGIALAEIVHFGSAARMQWQPVAAYSNGRHEGILLVNRATGTILSSNGNDKQVTLVNNPGSGRNAIWRPQDGIHYEAYNAIQVAANSNLNLNVQGKGPYKAGSRVIVYGWSGGDPNEVWNFIPTFDSPA